MAASCQVRSRFATATRWARGAGMAKFQPVRGTQDRFGEDAARFERVVDAFRAQCRLFGFRPVDVPVFEFTEVFARGMGETSDVVSKEMYTFPDRGGESLTLRPEFTAGIARAYVSNGWQQHGVLKLAAHGPAFRYERPQKGRYRQFHQIDAEVLGAGEPVADAELIALGHATLRALGIDDGVTCRINTVGDAPSRAAWREALVAYFGGHRDGLSAESRERLEKNPLRILDSKDAGDRALVADAPRIDAYLTSEAGAFFERVQRALDALGVPTVRDDALVRGLDYYRHTVFEFVTDRLGAQGTVLAGGRYDGLIEMLGGPPTPAVGFAGGIERLAMMVDAVVAEPADLAVVAETADAEDQALRIAAALRAAGFHVFLPVQGSAKKRGEAARKSDARAVLFVRDGKAERDSVNLANVHDTTAEATKTLRRVLEALPSPYSQLGGHDLRLGEH